MSNVFAKNLRRHIFPIILTPIIVSCVWLVIGLPILFVFIIDDAFSRSEFLKTIFYILSIVFALTIFISFPLTLMFEKIIEKSKILIAIIPCFPIIVLISLAWTFVSGNLFLIEPWGMPLFLFSFIFLCYWLVYWTPRINKMPPENHSDIA
jgi:hypothetical protein